jgi:lipopolysaccharide transport system permease protein
MPGRPRCNVGRTHPGLEFAGMATLSPVMRHAPLYRNLVRREVRQRYKGSALGLGWTLLNPLIMVAAYWLVFKFLFGSTIPDYALFIFVGLMVWTLFYGGITVAASSLVANASLVTKVSFPRQIIPLASMTANSVIAGAMLVIALPLCLVLGDGSPAPLVLLPVFLFLTACLTVGLGLLFGALNVYFRDVEHILTAVSIPWFFLTPIFYTFSTLPESARAHQWLVAALHWGNPVSPFVVAIQDILFFGTWPTVADSTYCVVVAAIALAIGALTFRRLAGEMAVEL